MKPTINRRAIFTLLLGAAALCGSAVHADQLDTIMAAKKLRVAIDTATPPFAMKDDKLSLIGSDFETAKLMAKDLGLELEVVPTTLANRVPFLQTDKADLVISAFSVTPERAKVVDFSVPYASIQVVVAAPKNVSITSIADLAGKKVISTRGTTNDQELSKIASPTTQIVRFDDDATTITAAVSGQADIVATAPTIMKAINEKSSAARQLEVKLTLKTNMLAIGIRKGETKLKEKIDAWVRANLKNGQLNSVYKKYHGTDLPAEVTQATGG